VCVRRYRKRLPLAQPTVSQHLKELKTRLIKGNFEGNAICYTSMKKASIKYEAFLHINTYLENKKINVVNFKLVENEVIRN
jgi:DNA-binding transcriptional ArsR family regulator